MKIKKLFPKFDVPVVFKDLKSDVGQYWWKSDCIVLDSKLKKGMPAYTKFVFLHEMIHATLPKNRLMRIDRLVENFGEYSPRSLSYRVEECIAEIGCLVAALKLGILNDYSTNVPLAGLKQNYTKDMYIPIREVRAAVKYFADDSTSFEEEINDIKYYLQTVMGMKFQDTYCKFKAG